jgi:hypothetical protein
MKKGCGRMESGEASHGVHGQRTKHFLVTLRGR